MASFSNIRGSVRTNGKKVDSINILLVAYEIDGDIHLTDILFQAGTIATLWTGHPSEIEWSFNA